MAERERQKGMRQREGYRGVEKEAEKGCTQVVSKRERVRVYISARTTEGEREIEREREWVSVFTLK